MFWLCAPLDGAIITGSVDGNRIWGKDIKNVNLNKVEWSPDGKTILIGTNELEVQSFDNMGNLIKKVPLSTLQALYGRSNAYKEVPNLVSLKWYKSSPIEHPLIIAFEDGWLQLMKHEADDFPVLLNTELKISSVEWSYAGDMFAVTGEPVQPIGIPDTTCLTRTFAPLGNGRVEEGASKNYLKLYNGQGELLQMVKVPGNEIFDCSWDRTGFKLALAVDSYIFFANLKPHFHLTSGFLTNSIVFALPSLNGKGKSRKLIFQELKSNETYEKDVNNFMLLATWQHCCAVVSKADSIAGPTGGNVPSAEKRSEMYSLALYNSIGTLLDRHMVNLKVRHCCLNSSRMVVASEDSFLVWAFSQPYNSGNLKSE